MNEKTVTFIVDGKEIKARPEQTIMKACDEAGVYIPRLCAFKDLSPFGSCRVCTVKVNGRPQAACTQPVGEGIVVESQTAEIQQIRRNIIDMLFVEGNHFCMFCEKSGNCELQAMAYRLGILAPKFPYMFPVRGVDASHPDIFIDWNRCILCARCIRTSCEIDGKNAYGFIGRGPHKRVATNSSAGLKGTDADVSDKAPANCPVGSLMYKRIGYAVPIGCRLYDKNPIGSDIEMKKTT